jgi:hypothetical protein
MLKSGWRVRPCSTMATAIATDSCHAPAALCAMAPRSVSSSSSVMMADGRKRPSRPISG